MKQKEELKQKILSGERITPEEGVSLFSWDLLELGRLADERRRLISPGEKVGFIFDRIINYTNVCEAECRFCAYHARAGRIEPYVLSIEEILEKTGELADAGGSQVMLQGGAHPDYKIDDLVRMASAVKERYPRIYLHSFSPTEVCHVSKKSGISIEKAVKMLKDAGVQSIPGASDLLVDRVRKRVCPRKITKDEWLGVMRALSENEMFSSATMTYGMGETLAEKIEHFDVIRNIQDETGIIMAFIPWSFSPANTELYDILPSTGVDYLKIVSIGRIYIDNVKNIQAGWLTEGLKLAQVALNMGANDMGGVLTEEVVVRATGIDTGTDVVEIADIIKNAGRIPVLRDSRYREIRSYE